MRLNEASRRPVYLRASADLCNVPCFNDDLVRRLRAASSSDAAVEEVRILFAALADRSRIRIIEALSDGDELCVCDVAHLLGASVSAASHHLRKLRRLGFLRQRNDGRMVYYSLPHRSAADLVRQAFRRTRNGRWDGRKA